MSRKTEFYKTAGAANAFTGDSPFSNNVVQHPQQPYTVVESSKDMWDYLHRRKVDGIPLSEEAGNMQEETMEQIRNGLELSSTVHVFLKLLSPENPESVKEYEELCQNIVTNNWMVHEHRIDFLPDRASYLVLLRYAECIYNLHPRYNEKLGVQNA